MQRGTKSDNLTVVLRVEFGKNQVDSAEMSVTGDVNAPAQQFNTTAVFDIAPHTHEGIEFVGNHPVVVRVLEAAKADKKKKESVLTEIANAKFDLVSLLQGQNEFDATAQMTTVVQLVETSEGPLPIEAVVSIRTSTSMLSEQQLKECNLLTVAVDGVFSVPDSWPVVHPTQPPTATYSLQFPFAETATADRMFTFSDGIVSPAPHPSVSRQIKIEVRR